MPSKRKHRHNDSYRSDKGLLKRRSAQRAPRSRQNALVQRTSLNPGSHSAKDILQLQRLVGNQAVLRQLGRRTAPAVQRAKGVEERATKHHRIAKAKENIKALSPKIKDDLADHLFDAKPFSKPVDAKDPQGLHAYKSGGTLPSFVEEVSIKGSKGRVHTLTWKNRQGTKTKSSTMFPDWMPPDHVKTLVVLAYPQDSKVVNEKIEFAKLGISKDDIKTHISHGQDIDIGKSGETVYPLK
jgi:hypothetical protein